MLPGLSGCALTALMTCRCRMVTRDAVRTPTGCQRESEGGFLINQWLARLRGAPIDAHVTGGVGLRPRPPANGYKPCGFEDLRGSSEDIASLPNVATTRSEYKPARPDPSNRSPSRLKTACHFRPHFGRTRKQLTTNSELAAVLVLKWKVTRANRMI